MAKNKKAPVVEPEEVATATATAPEPETTTEPALDASGITVSADTLLEVWERRFLNPGGRSSVPIRLKVEGMVTRWINTSIEGRHHRAVYDQGWQPVPLKLLADPASIPDLYKHPHGIVARGERGKEVLMMMPAQVFQKIQRRKAEIETKKLHNIRSEVAQAAAAKLGPKHGEFAERGETDDGLIRTIGSINFGKERVTPDE